MKVYCIQHDISWEDKKSNLARVQMLLEVAGPEAGSLVILPEMFSTGFSMNVPVIREGEERLAEKFLAGMAQRFGIYVLGGVVRAGSSGRGRNESVVFAPEGKEAARYSKMQPFTAGGEGEHYEAGAAPVTFECGGFTVAPFICYDLRFPEHFRAAAVQGAQLFTVIASWPAARMGHWVRLLQARAIENQAYVAGVNRVGTDPRYTYKGRSMIVSPRGEILADAGDGEKVISAEADLSALLAYRKELPFLADMRREKIQGSA